MARATGPIHYLEHTTPMKDESGKYTIHPMFVKNDTMDMEGMKDILKRHSVMNPNTFEQAIETAEDEILLALREGNEVRLGDMFIIRPKLRVVRHNDENGREWKKEYHEGDLIPANEVEVCGIDVQPTKEFVKKFLREHPKCSRQYWGVKAQPKAPDKEFAGIKAICEEQGYITVKDMISHFGVTRYHACKVLEGMCEEPDARMVSAKEGPVRLYRLRKKE